MCNVLVSVAELLSMYGHIQHGLQMIRQKNTFVSDHLTEPIWTPIWPQLFMTVSKKNFGLSACIFEWTLLLEPFGRVFLNWNCKKKFFYLPVHCFWGRRYFNEIPPLRKKKYPTCPIWEGSVISNRSVFFGLSHVSVVLHIVRGNFCKYISGGIKNKIF